MDILEKLNWRYATKRFDTSKKVSDKDFEMLIEAVRLSPSSWGLQPWKFVVVKDKSIREKLKIAAWGQTQITDASHLVVLCSLNELNQNQVDKYIGSVAKTRGQSLKSLVDDKKMLNDFVSGDTKENLFNWMSQQVYIALGVLLISCAVNDIDACPMEGFEKEKFDEILNLRKFGIKSQVLCAIGYRSATDKHASDKKVRFLKKDIVIEI